MMRYRSTVGFLLTLLPACDELVAPSAVALDRTYVVGVCVTTTSAPAPPPNCLTSVTAASATYVDSGRVVLRPDRTAAWMLGTHGYLNPNYPGGCGAPCGHQPGAVDSGEGTYTFDAGDLVLTIGTRTMALTTGAPSRVSSSWIGPDSLVFPHGTQTAQNGRVIFRPAS